MIDPVKQWKLRPTDLDSLDRWDDYTRAKETMFAHTDLPHARWTVVRSNDKQRGRIAAMRWVLSTLDYPHKDTDKDTDVVSVPDPLLVGPPDTVYEQSEQHTTPPTTTN